MAAVLKSENRELPCVLIPIGQTHLLLPNVSVAEILPWRRIKSWPEAPAWCLGLFGWRGETVPVIRFETLNGQQSVPTSGRALLIMNRARHKTGRAFYGLAADGLPRLIHVSSDDLETQSATLQPAEVAGIRVGSEMALIPNLSYIEEQLSYLPKVGASSAQSPG